MGRLTVDTAKQMHRTLRSGPHGMPRLREQEKQMLGENGEQPLSKGKTQNIQEEKLQV